MKKIFFLVLTFILVTSNLAYADILEQNNQYQDALDYANGFFSLIDQNDSLRTDYILLYDINGKVNAIFVEFEKDGYAIINVNDYTIPEFSLESNKKLNPSIKYLYNGPGALIEFNKRNIKSYSKSSFIYLANEGAQKNVLQLNTTIEKSMITRSSSTFDDLDQSLRNWDYNTNNNCGSVAAAIVINYRDRTYNSNYLDSSIQENEQAVVNLMGNYVGNSWTSLSELRDGINDYLASRGLSRKFVSQSYFNYPKLKSEIASNRPVIIDTDAHGTYGEHWIIASGYLELMGYQYVTVTDGLGKSGVQLIVNSSLDDLLYCD